MAFMKSPLLRSRSCKPLAEDAKAISAEQAAELLGQLPGWAADGKAIEKHFKFEDYHHTMTFVNAVAWIAHSQNHHPDLRVGFDHCDVRFSTHSVGGLSENDFICADKVEALLKR